LLNAVKPEFTPVTAPWLVMTVILPAIALLVKDIVPEFPELSAAVTKFCVTPELLVMPTPLMVSVSVGLAVMVKALPPELNTMPFTSVLAEIETPVVLDEANVAVSVELLGTVIGDQLVAVFQSPEPGARSHCALPA
jgi:hypothetical protein